MATRQIKKTNSVKKKEEVVDTIQTTEVKSVNSEPRVERKFDPSDGIPCKSIVVGGLYMEGAKTHLLYEWSDSGDVTYVEYQDLLAATRSNSPYVKKPYFVIEDEDFIAQNPKIGEIYKNMYSFSELSDVILELNASDMKATILSLPSGAQDSLKYAASQLVKDGTLDSVAKIRALDEIFGTELSLMAGI